jgi:hypothetical protein
VAQGVGPEFSTAKKKKEREREREKGYSGGRDQEDHGLKPALGK